MIKTIDVANDRASDSSQSVLPAEVARGAFIRNTPSLQALKLMHLMIGTAAGRMADDVRHEIRLAEIRSISGMKNHDRNSIQPLFEELRAMVMTYDEIKTQKITIGGLIDHAVIDYKNEANGETLITWYFARMFRDMARESNHWAILDRQTVFHLTSKYSVLLFQHISSLVNLKHQTEKTFTIAELRAVFGIAESKIKRFADLNKDVLSPAINDINQLSRLSLMVTTIKTGRTVTSVTVSWKKKTDISKTNRELRFSKVGRKARQSGLEETIYEPFPSEGSIHFTKWEKLAKEHLVNSNRELPDLATVTQNFRKFIAIKKIDMSSVMIEKTFIGFCKSYNK